MTDEDENSKEQLPLLGLPATDEAQSSSQDGQQLTRHSHSDSGFIHDMVQESSHKHYPLWIAVCFGINFSVGGGVLGLPEEYFGAGYVLGTIILLLCSVLTYVTYMYVNNLMYRAEVITHLCVSRGMPKFEIKDNPSGIQLFLTNGGTETVDVAEINQLYVDFYRNEYELNHLIGIFCGHRSRLVYEVCWISSKLITLWSYSTLFASSLARSVGISIISDSCNIEKSDYTAGCRLLYSFYVLVFLVWCIFIALMDFTEQIGIQVAGAFMRGIIILLMVVTSIGLMYGDLYYDGDKFEQLTGNYSTPHYGDGISAWKWSGLLYFLAVANFAYSAQFAVPDIIQPLRHSDRPRGASLWRYVMIFLIFIYCVSGVCISVYFGNEVEDPCSLAWKYYSGFEWSSSRPGGSYVIAWMVILFPPLDMLTAYPLHCITLANTIEQSILKETDDENQDSNDTDATEMSDNDVGCCAAPVRRWRSFRSRPLKFRYKALLRLFIILFCTGLALLSWDFDFIIILSGVCGLVSLNFLPAWAELKSRKMMADISGNDEVYKTPVTDWSSHPFWPYATMVVAFIATIGVVVELATTYS